MLKHEFVLMLILVCIISSLFIIQAFQSTNSFLTTTFSNQKTEFVSLPSIQEFEGSPFEQEQLARTYYFVNGLIPANTPLINTNPGWAYQKVIS